ncbi:MAG: hypothetical protein A2428_03255 [Bdellovibrionales bacterium RIFOXYC1_FULL_54_43]|nr:MAG: hypothetical protein A2428_03255 [Bdellovibrionales bacterium RIFOXYC1_FULL_54_43]OFZ82698.1 MAG: hypothetical protein A2603_02690 [Bdellovibrionales bacterium RIFOXYD1_FULL_55_31]
MERDKLLNEFEAAELLGLTVSSLRTRRARPGPNPIPYKKIGRSVRYSENELKRYLEQNSYDYAGAKRIA